MIGQNLQEIIKRMNNGEDIIGREEKYNSINLDSRFPDFLIKNKKFYKNWIVD